MQVYVMYMYHATYHEVKVSRDYY